MSSWKLLKTKRNAAIRKSLLPTIVDTNPRVAKNINLRAANELWAQSPWVSIDLLFVTRPDHIERVIRPYNKNINWS